MSSIFDIGNIVPVVQGLAVVIAAACTAMWINDKFDLGGYVKEEHATPR